MKNDENIERLIKRFCAGRKAQVKTSVELDERILADALPAQNKLETTQSAAVQPKVWRTIMRNRMTKYTAAAVIILAIVIGFIELDKPVGASVAFAAAMDRVREAGTFSCTEIFEVSYEDGEEHGKYLLKQKWMFKEPDWERHESLTSPWPKYIGETTITDYGTRQKLVLRPVEKTARLCNLVSEYTIDDKTGELKLTQLDTRLRDRLLEWSQGAVDDHGEVKLDGKLVRVLQSRQGNRVTMVWIDPETNYPVQIEGKWTDQSRSPVMYTSIQIDTELDDDLFSLEPPEGYSFTIDKSGWPDSKAKIAAKMRHLSLACFVYADKHDNRFPGSLTDLVNTGIITNEVLNRVLAVPDELDGPPAIQYRQPNTGVEDFSNEVIFYEIYDQWPDGGIVVCFADGHCELISDQNRFEELVK
jgi:outer membrane lipoprotein-sorting protein